MSVINYLNMNITWAKTKDAFYPYETILQDGSKLTLRINDFPAEPLYSLFKEKQPVGDIEEWPSNWKR